MANPFSVICIQESYLVNINVCSVKGRLVTGEAIVGVKAMKAGKITTRCRFFDTMTAYFLWATTSPVIRKYTIATWY